MSETVEPLVGWCSEHDAVAVVYDDGSTQCMHLLIIETSGTCEVEPVPSERLYRGPDFGRHLQPQDPGDHPQHDSSPSRDS